MRTLPFFLVLVFFCCVRCTRVADTLPPGDADNGGLALPGGFEAVTVVDSLGRDIINIGNAYSFKNGNKPLVFSINYRIDANNKPLAEGATTAKERWFFPFAKDNYLLSVANTFPADRFSIKVEDVDGEENGGKFKTVIIPLYSYNMYILCSNESDAAGVKFGRKMNKPVDIVLEKQK